MPEERNDSMNSQRSVSGSTVSRPVKKGSTLRKLMLVLSYIIVGLIVWKVATTWQMNPARQQELAEKEIATTISKVGALMILPSDETPQVATINDAESLSKTQAFFAGSQNGDQIIIYLKAQKAIVYRPSEDKIVNVGPIIAENEQAPANAANNKASTNPSTSSPKSSDADESEE